jgi:hypothetical protein
MRSLTTKLLAFSTGLLLHAIPAEAGFVFQTIDFAGATAVQARGINDTGEIVGYRTTGGITETFLRSGNSDSFFRVSDSDTFGLGIDNSRTVVGGVATPLPGQDSFFRTSAGAVTQFQPMGNTNAAATGINDAGDIVASGNAFGTGGYLRRANGTTTAVNYTGQAGDTIFKTNATDITNGGVLIGHAIGQSASGFFGRGWLSMDAGATFVDLVVPGEQFTYAWAANDNGWIVGDYSTGFGGVRTGFLYLQATSTFVSFNVPGADWTVPTGINNFGEVVGFSRDAASGRVTGFMTTVPEPSSWALMLSAGTVFLLRRHVQSRRDRTRV